MRHVDPLDYWLLGSPSIGVLHRLRGENLRSIRSAMQELPGQIVSGGLMESTLAQWSLGNPGMLPAQDVHQLEDLYRQVYAAGGTGTSYVQEGLLNLIGAGCHVRSIPFWMELLDLARPRDQFARKRRTFALAALAYQAIMTGVHKPEECLHQASAHPNPDVRAEAIAYWRRVYEVTEQAFPRRVLTALQAIVADDAAFGPRFQARAVLRAAGHPAPLDNPGGVYALKVKFKWAKSIYRTIELRAEQTLDNLHHAIQRAIEWDSDHLYSFYMNSELRDDRFCFSCPYEDDRPPWTDEAVLGELGLVKRHKFLYYFDYGDGHQFEIEVVDVRPANQVEPDRYPRVVASHGEAPEQYPRYE